MKKKNFWQSSNFWHSLVMLIGQIWVGATADQVLDGAQGVIETVFAPEIQIAAIIGAAYTFLNMIYQLFLKPKPQPEPEPIEKTIEKVLVEKKLIAATG